MDLCVRIPCLLVYAHNNELTGVLTPGGGDIQAVIFPADTQTLFTGNIEIQKEI